MPASKLHCQACSKSYYSRSDSLYCSERCRGQIRRMDSKIITPLIPQSGVPGVTFNRVYQRWEVRIKEDQRWKYIGGFKDLAEAIKLQQEVLGAGEDRLSSRTHEGRSGQQGILLLHAVPQREHNQVEG